jgi:hypothetical protein
MRETHTLQVMDAAGAVRSCTLTVIYGEPKGGCIPAEVVYSDAQIRLGPYADDSLYACLQRLRDDLESRGLLLLCSACRIDAKMTKVVGQMSGGTRIFIINPATEPPYTAVNLLDPAPTDAVGTKAQNAEFVQRWNDSRKPSFPAPKMSFLQRVRQRPGMYVGSYDTTLCELLASLFSKSVQLGLPAHASLTIDLRETDCTIHYKGPLPCVLSDGDVSHIAATLNSFFYSRNEYLTATSITAAVAKSLTIEEFTGSLHVRHRFENGEPLGIPAVIDSTADCGLTIHLVPDPAIFRKDLSRWRFDPLVGRLNDLAIAYSPLAIRLIDQKSSQECRFQYVNGLRSYLAQVTHSDGQITEHELTEGDTTVRMALQYYPNYPLVLHTFVNATRTVGGGSHVNGFLRACQSLAKIHEDSIHWHVTFRIPDGFAAVIAVYSASPGLVGPLHLKIDNDEIEDMVFRLASQALSQRVKR